MRPTVRAGDSEPDPERDIRKETEALMSQGMSREDGPRANRRSTTDLTLIRRG